MGAEEGDSALFAPAPAPAAPSVVLIDGGEREALDDAAPNGGLTVVEPALEAAFVAGGHVTAREHTRPPNI